jgi:ATP-binding cassette subfamily B protein
MKGNMEARDQPLKATFSKPPPLFAHLALIKRLVVLVWQASPRFFVGSLSMNMLSGLLPLGSIYISSNMLALLANAMHGNMSSSLLLHKLTVLLVLMATLAALNAVLNQFSGTVLDLYQTHVANYVQGLIAKKATSLDFAFFENVEFQNKLQNASSEAASRPFAIVQQLMNIASSLTTLVSLGIVVLLWHVWLAPLILIPPLALLWVTSSLAARNVEMNLKRTETVRRAGYFRGVLTAVGAAKEIRLFNLPEFFLSSLHRVWEDLYEQDRQFARRRLLSRGVLAVVLSLSQPLIIGYVAMQLLYQHITFRQFSLYTQSVSSLQGRLNSLAVSLGQLYEGNLFVSNVFEFLAIQPEVEAPRPAGAATGISALPEIEFRHVGFRYPGSEAWVLNDVSFKLHPGERMALVGDNGAGKSTIAKLMVGLYEPDMGAILMDGVDIKELDRVELRNYFSMIMQDFVIFNLSAQENIGVGRVENIHNREMIESAAHAASLDEIIKKFPHGYETILARSFKRGHELSGGQRQLVALARTIFRNAPVLVVDEPTSALDVHHEMRFTRKLLDARNTKRQSILFICHRLTAVRHAQRILVLGEGQVLEEGSHQQLMALNGRYAEMFNLQLQMYGDSWLDEPESNFEAGAGSNSASTGGDKIS